MIKTYQRRIMPTLAEIIERRKKEPSEPLTHEEKNTPTKTHEETSLIEDTEKKKNEPTKIKKDIIKTLPATLKNIRQALDNTKITQDDKWFLTRYFIRNTISTIRIKESDLRPILLDFFNKKLKTN